MCSMEIDMQSHVKIRSKWCVPAGGGGGTWGIPGWECTAGTLEPLIYTRPDLYQSYSSSAEFCYATLY